MTQAQFSEQQFMKWVRFVGRLKHSVFKTAKNKLFPSYTLHVTKNRAAGDFRTIQDAIDSLPFINLLRVVIKVHAGVYTCVILIPKLYRYRTNTDLARYGPAPEFPWKPEQIPSYYRHHPDTGPTY
ncbi:PREDICTED: probable pectinesterase 53 [Prunus dulcis]|uniref:PREDICTED: probable pectinesterase 53 n=1 Tax=Prunus dulcis TaxID=3755 RepID=A0A5E4GBQ4_PRUDU|nr:PREDICTED: probable pectinesterase 53 [Prunus dulcis]